MKLSKSEGRVGAGVAASFAVRHRTRRSPWKSSGSSRYAGDPRAGRSFKRRSSSRTGSTFGRLTSTRPWKAASSSGRSPTSPRAGCRSMSLRHQAWCRSNHQDRIAASPSVDKRRCLPCPSVPLPRKPGILSAARRDYRDSVATIHSLSHPYALTAISGNALS